MRTYRIATDAASVTLEAESADEAAAAFAASEGLNAHSIDDLGAEIDDMGGWLVCNEDGVEIARFGSR